MRKPQVHTDCSISGRHRVGRKQIDPADPSIQRARCLDCGYPVVRSLVSRRWVISAYLGGSNLAKPGFPSRA